MPPIVHPTPPTAIHWRQRIGTRLAAGFGLVLALTVAMSVLGMSELRRIAQLDEQLDLLAERMQAIERWKGATSVNLARALAIADSGQQAEVVAAFDPPMKETSARISTLQKTLEDRLDHDEERRVFAAIGERRKAYVAFRAEAGPRLAGDAGTTMREVVASVQRVTDIIGEITAAAAADSLKAQAQQLAEVVRVFRVADEFPTTAA